MNRLMLLALVVVGVLPTQPLAADLPTAEQVWARGIVKDFFHSALKQDPSALGLLSPELAKCHEKVSEFYPLYYCENFHIISEEVSPQWHRSDLPGQPDRWLLVVGGLPGDLRAARGQGARRPLKHSLYSPE